MTAGRSTGGRRATVAALCCLALACLGAPSPAAGKGSFTGGFFGESGTRISFSLGHASGGTLRVSSLGRKTVELTVSKGAQSVSYRVAGAASEDGVRANLGRAGRIDVSFEPSGRPQSLGPVPFCKGREATVTAGAFVGTIRFRGFDGFVDFRAGRAKGEVTKTPPMRCHLPGNSHKHHKPRHEGEPEEDTTVALIAGPPCGRLAFIAVGDSKVKGFSLFAAVSAERVGRVRVSRFVLLPVEGDDPFSFDSSLTTATVEPPLPFHGSATFQRGAEGGLDTWSGDLRVAFLDGPVALTGAPIRAALVRSLEDEGVAVGSAGCGRGAVAARLPLSLP